MSRYLSGARFDGEGKMLVRAYIFDVLNYDGSRNKKPIPVLHIKNFRQVINFEKNQGYGVVIRQQMSLP